MTKTPGQQTAAAYRELVDLLEEIPKSFLSSEHGVVDELDVVEGYRYVAHVLATVLEFHMEGDPERPRFTPIVTPERKYLGDNPDALYYWARIRGDRSYRVRGRRGREAYLSFTIHARDPDGGYQERVVADINDRDLDIAPDGSYELILSPNEHPGNWVKLDPDSSVIMTRHYYLEQGSAAADPDIHVELRIDPLDSPGPAPIIDDATFGERLRGAATFLRANTVGRPKPGTEPPVPFVSTVPNDVGPPFSFRNMPDFWGAVDIYYSSGQFELALGEALVMEGTLPEAAFVNVVAWNRFMQTLDYVSRRCSLNNEQMVLDADRRYRIVLADEDPGVPNWIDTQGHRKGTIFWRFLLPDTTPEKPVCTVVPVKTLIGG